RSIDRKDFHFVRIFCLLTFIGHRQHQLSVIGLRMVQDIKRGPFGSFENSSRKCFRFKVVRRPLVRVHQRTTKCASASATSSRTHQTLMFSNSESLIRKVSYIRSDSSNEENSGSGS